MKKVMIFMMVFFMLGMNLVQIYSYTATSDNLKLKVYIETRRRVPLYTENGIILSINDGFSEKEVINIGKTNDPKPTPKGTVGDGIVRRWALCIGIADYEGTSNDLNYCDDDAREWKNFLQTNNYTVTILLDSQATATNIDNAINQLLANEDADDYVVFTYSGHGTKYGRYGSCIVSHDLYLMTNSWFVSKFSNADSAHIYITFDACQIGNFKNAVVTNRFGAFASNKLYSYEDPKLQNGVFTYYQLDGWGIYTNFEQDSAYAVQKMKTWASQHKVKVDPFYADKFAGYMYP